jgi:hypothetical protein
LVKRSFFVSKGFKRGVLHTLAEAMANVWHAERDC